ncbi:hypothetical protein D3C81_1072760 [compost metagenome]
MKRSFRNPLLLLRKVGFYFSSGFASMFIIPILGVVSIGFTICAVIAAIGGLLRTFGVNWFRMDLGNGIEVPTLLSLPAALLLSGILLGIAWFSFVGLRSYLSWIITKYRKGRFTRI